MKVYLKEPLALRQRYLLRKSSTDWRLMTEEPHDFDWEVRALHEFEVQMVESTLQHCAAPFNALIFN